ncbi:hypothetical protein [Paraburkholderia sp. J12]|uniref:hypothetical protein n=1 Tax=Paraburkholderia sp. J12 TaxID=2805432 RepID=UPI002ABE211A|nr:hypothetical protein [Paraburkholderia sp. J12]
MTRPSVFLAPARSLRPTGSLRSNRTARTFRGITVAGAVASTLALSGCYYYYPYGYGYGTYPAYATQQETAVATAGNTPAPNAVPDAQYPGPLYSTQPVAIAVPAYSAWPVYPAYYPAWGWGAPAVSFGFGWSGGHWH